MIASVAGATYSYPGRVDLVLDGVSCELSAGELVLVAGESGSGKSTLLRLFNGLVPQFYGGRYGGVVRVGGLDPSRTPARRMASVAGMVFQEPEAQGIADLVEDDIAFGMEQRGVPRSAMLVRSADLLSEFQVEHLRHRRLSTLSGGERQLIAITSVMALDPAVLLLDEPLSQLDAKGAVAVVSALGRLADRGVAVVVAEHRQEQLLPVVDTVWNLDHGRLTARAADRLEARPESDRMASNGVPIAGASLLSAHGLTVEFGETRAVDGVDLSIREGEVVALLGANGSGKTTLLRALAGLVRQARGDILVRGLPAPSSVAARSAVLGLVPQDPALALYHETVRDEVAASLRHRARVSPTDRALEDWNTRELADRNPRDLSAGQQERVAIAAMLAHDPPVWMLDEPTRGADGPAKAWLASRLSHHAASGGAAIVATHDSRWASSIATRVVRLENGRVSLDVPAAQGFAAPAPAAVPRRLAPAGPGPIG